MTQYAQLRPAGAAAAAPTVPALSVPGVLPRRRRDGRPSGPGRGDRERGGRRRGGGEGPDVGADTGHGRGASARLFSVLPRSLAPASSLPCAPLPLCFPATPSIRPFVSPSLSLKIQGAGEVRLLHRAGVQA
jgi:hypothetical protein